MIDSIEPLGAAERSCFDDSIMISFLRAITDYALFHTTSESVISLKKLPSPCQVCLNDVISTSLPGNFGDPEPMGTVWIDSTEFEYQSKRSAQNNSLLAQVSFNRKIAYEPADPKAKGTAFVSGNRGLGAGNLRVRIPRKKPRLIAGLLGVFGFIFWMADGTSRLVGLWEKLSLRPEGSHLSLPKEILERPKDRPHGGGEVNLQDLRERIRHDTTEIDRLVKEHDRAALMRAEELYDQLQLLAGEKEQDSLSKIDKKLKIEDLYLKKHVPAVIQE
ncbi:MAG: hypothetical protein ACXVCH_00675 [Bdellovibrionota bacterium]